MVETLMTWKGLLYAVVLVFGVLGFFVKEHWPRNKDGKLMNFDEFDEFMERFPKTPTGLENFFVKLYLSKFFMTLITLAVFFTALFHVRK